MSVRLSDKVSLLRLAQMKFVFTFSHFPIDIRYLPHRLRLNTFSGRSGLYTFIYSRKKHKLVNTVIRKNLFKIIMKSVAFKDTISSIIIINCYKILLIFFFIKKILSTIFFNSKALLLSHIYLKKNFISFFFFSILLTLMLV